MRIGVWHWAGAAVLSFTAHAALLAGVELLDRAAEQRGDGTPAVIWGLVAHALDEAGTADVARDGAPDGAQAPETSAETADAPEMAEPTDAAEADPAEMPLLAEPLAEPAPRPIARERGGEASVTPPQRKPQSARERRPTPRQASRAPSGPVGQAAGEASARADTAGRADYSAYSGLVLAHLRRHKRYPPEARQGGLQGTARLTFVLGARGQVREARVSGRSGHAVLDREALAMVRRAAPFPPIPQALRRSDMTFTVPIHFTR